MSSALAAGPRGAARGPRGAVRRRALPAGGPFRSASRRTTDRTTDRTIGQAAAQHDVLHRAGGYDLEVDTSLLDPEAAAEVIARAVEAGVPAVPFARLGP